MSLLIMKDHATLVSAYSNFTLPPKYLEDGELDTLREADITFILDQVSQKQGLRVIHSDVARSCKIIDLSKGEDHLDFSQRVVEHYTFFAGVPEKVKQSVTAKFKDMGEVIEL